MPKRSAESRRSRQRRELTAEILDIARRQLDAGGRSGVSLRAIAREVGMNPASLYTYVASLDDVFTALTLQSYRRLAVAVTPEAGEERNTAVERLTTFAARYRRWAVEHPAQFNLIYTAAIPGYAAPGGGTFEAEQAVLRPMLAALSELSGTEIGDAPRTMTDRSPLFERVMGIHAMIHGLVLLEINHHVPLGPDYGAVLRNEVVRAATDLTTPFPDTE